jgi:transposase
VSGGEMTDHVKGFSRHQAVLLPDRLDDYVDEENPVRFIDAFVDHLDIGELGFRHAEPEDTGRPPYDPGDILKLHIYGYLNQVRSSRRMEKECKRNMELMWLMRRLTPDHKTIADFRRDNAGCIKAVFREFILICGSLGLFGAEIIGVDGSKFRAVNSMQRHYTEEKIKDALTRLDKRVTGYLETLEANDRVEDEEQKTSDSVSLREKIGKLEERRRMLLEVRGLLRETGRKEVSLTDPDSRLMKNHGRFEVCYNVRTAVDSKNKLIVEYDVSNAAGDQGQLSGVALEAMEALGVDRIEALGDGGFYSGEDLKRCLDNGVTPYVPEPEMSARGLVKSSGVPTPEFRRERFTYDKGSDSYKCPAGHRLGFHHWIENAYGRRVGVYSTGACGSCPFFQTSCTRNKKGRILWRWEHEEVVEDLRIRMGAEGRGKMDLRKQLCEHPFGTIKRWHNHGFLLLRGLGRVAGEVGLTLLAYDMIRAINLVGVGALVASVAR